MTSPAGLEVKSVGFTAGEKTIVADVTLSVLPGETLAVLGPSGCGKTTLLRLIAALEPLAGGSVHFNGADLAGVPAHRRNFGMVFQDFALFPHMSVERNVAFGLARSELSRARVRERVSELLEMAGLAGFEARTTEALSGGERQRVALARALAPQPRLLMFDEPLGSLDRGLRERLLVELRSILERVAIPAIYVTHDQFEAFAIADRMVIMRDGRIVRTGQPQEVYERPGSEFVARFLGLGNIIDATLDGCDMATTGDCCWGGITGKPGPARLLLRGDGATVAQGMGTGVVPGIVSGKLFQGARQRIELETPVGPLEFEFDSALPLPPAGAELFVHVPTVQVLDREPSPR